MDAAEVLGLPLVLLHQVPLGMALAITGNSHYNLPRWAEHRKAGALREQGGRPAFPSFPQQPARSARQGRRKEAFLPGQPEAVPTPAPCSLPLPPTATCPLTSRAR